MESIKEKIGKLKSQKNAVILAHNYQIGEVQDIADFTGDSLGLSQQAASTEADVIVFCGVRFMAETAKILSPGKKVLLPEKNAGCPMANMITGADVREMKRKHPGAIVVCYVNTTAEVKAESDYCCTSSNAVKLVRSLGSDKEIIFVPDKYLGSYVREQTGRDVILWPGYCATHAKIDPEDIKRLKEEFPDSVVLAHPEANTEVWSVADKLLSTGQMLSFAKESDKKSFIIATEIGIIHTLEKQNPEKEFIPVSRKTVCPNMKKINIEKILWSLENDEFEIELEEEVMNKARLSLERMLDVV
jgi:quinolinate synthase